MAFIVAAIRTAQTRRVVAAVLARAGHTALLFTAGAPALAEVQAGMPDAVVLDDQLSGMTGLQVRAAMRLNPAVAGIPVVLCSATLVGHRVRTLRSSGDLVVGTPYLSTQLRVAVDTVLHHPDVRASRRPRARRPRVAAGTHVRLVGRAAAANAHR